MRIFIFTKKRLIVGISFLALVAVLLVFSGRGGTQDDIEVQAVMRGDVIEIVSETGSVEPARAVDLAFEQTGRVVSVFVNEGDTTTEGSRLIALDAGKKQADLAAARASLNAEQARLDELLLGGDPTSLSVQESSVESAEATLKSARADLEKTIKQHDQLVENARKTLFSSDLEAHFVGDAREGTSYSYTPPTITGTYESEKTGVYEIDLYSSGAASGASFRVSGLESDTQSVSTERSVPLGTHGLYIQFPENFAKGHGVLWEVPIPNTRSSSYLTNKNAYEAALDARDVAIEKAENAVESAEIALEKARRQYTQESSSARSEQVTAQRAAVEQMQARVDSAAIALAEMTLTAPFSGTVTSIDIEEGELVTPTVPVLSFISDEHFELVVHISESDIQEVSADDPALVTFDAYNDAQFEAKVTRIAPSAEVTEGVRTFRVTLQFTERDPRIRAGLSADIDILAAERHDVLAVPTRSIIEREDGKFVRVLEEGGVSYIPVETGLRGSDGMTEIIGGIEAGTEIITFADEDAIERLEAN